jgi:hypothetical protein
MARPKASRNSCTAQVQLRGARIKSNGHATRRARERSSVQRRFLPASSYPGNATMQITIVADRRRCPYRGGRPGNCSDPLRPEEVLGRQGPHSSFEGASGLLQMGAGPAGRRRGRVHAAPDRNRRGTIVRMAQAAARAIPGKEGHAGWRSSAAPCVSSGRHWTWQCCAFVTSGNRFAGKTGFRALKRARYA